VRKIFALAKGGLGISKIRKILTSEKIPRPAASAENDGHNIANCDLETDEKRCLWSNNSVRDILRNPDRFNEKRKETPPRPRQIFCGRKRPPRNIDFDTNEYPSKIA